MPIKTGDVKLLKSAVMADVPEGGGGPTGNAIPDGVSNAIFPDISELDRARGRVNMRKVFMAVHSDDTDTYLGANIIVAEPPKDPRVSITLFNTRQTFDTRQQAVARMEAYKIPGPEFDGYLFENHVQGQSVLQLFQHPDAVAPVVGQALVLVEGEGTTGEKRQAVMITEVSIISRTFVTSGGGGYSDYKANIATLGLSDRLRYDFTGSPASRSYARSTNATKVRETVVAEAGSYAGVVPLTRAGAVGDFSVQVSSIFTQLVPSAQTETPLSDLRINGRASTLVATGGVVTRSLTLGFSVTQAMHVGAPVYPGSLRITRSGVTLTDAGQLLMLGPEQVGTVDHDNGIATLLRDVFGTAPGTHTVEFVPAAGPEQISEQSVIRVTPEGRSLSYAITLANPPLPGSVVWHYRAQGRYYVLRDTGDGKLKGTDASYGAGSINYTTGALVVTQGALPDAGSAILIEVQSDVVQVRASNTTLLNDGRLYIPINSNGQLSEEAGSKSFAPGSLTIAWDDNGQARVVHDDGLGKLTGDATGVVAYSAGVAYLSPNVLPPPGTPILLDVTSNSKVNEPSIPLSGTLAATNIKPGSVGFLLPLTIIYSWGGSLSYAPGTHQLSTGATVYDRAGVLYFRDTDAVQTELACGTIDYATGDYNVTAPAGVPQGDVRGPMIYGLAATANSSGTAISHWDTLTAPNKTRTMHVPGGVRLSINYATELPNADALGITATELRARVLMVPGRVLRGVSLSAAGRYFVQQPDDTLVADPSPTTGIGTPAGVVSSALGRVSIANWTAGGSSVISNWRGLIVPPSEGIAAPFCAYQTAFRTATSPVRPGSLSVIGSMQDGTPFNVSVGSDGKINGARVKGIFDAENGLGQLYFVNPDATSGPMADLSFLGIPGVGSIRADLAVMPSLRYNAVAYAYLPLDASLLGIDPVMLPSDGRVPIFQRGGDAVVGHTASIEATVTNGQTIYCGRVRLSRVRVIGQDGVVIHTGYSTDLEAGTVLFTNTAGYAQPVRIEHRVEDMAVVQQIDISGLVTFTRQLSHDYPVGSYVSSALTAGDVFARVSVVFEQLTWTTGGWSDSLQGPAATAKFNHRQYPITVTNRGAVTERFRLHFTSQTTYEVIGEHIGVIAVGNTSADCAPINPSTGVPYLTIPWQGFGSGWVPGNQLRINTIGAEVPAWVVRTILQGPETVPDDSFVLLGRGDVDNPK